MVVNGVVGKKFSPSGEACWSYLCFGFPQDFSGKDRAIDV